MKAPNMKLVGLVLPFLLSLPAALRADPNCSCEASAQNAAAVAATCANLSHGWSGSLVLRASPGYPIRIEIHCMASNAEGGVYDAAGLPICSDCGGIGSPSDTASPAVPKPKRCSGSDIQLDNQVVGERIPLVGVPFDLHYVSNRVVGRRADYTVATRLTTDTPLADVTGYRVVITDPRPGNVVHSADYVKAPNLFDRYVWTGSSGLNTRLLLVKADEFHSAWANSLTLTSTVFVGNSEAKRLGFGGWAPGVLHFYDVTSKRLYRGDGAFRSVDAKTLANGELQVAEEDGSVVYEFASTGRHLRTRLGLTGGVILAFGYGAQGTLATITEPFGRVTTFQRNGSGNLTSIIGPFGTTTAVTLDAQGYLASVNDPAGDTYRMTYYGTGGLLRTFSTPTNRTSTFTYDVDGNLLVDTHSGGRLAKIASQSSAPWDIRKTLTTKLGRVVSLSSTFFSSPGSSSYQYQRTTVAPTGEQVTLQDSPNQLSYQVGLLNFTGSFTDDPRFGNQARLQTGSSGSMSGAARNTSYQNTVILGDLQNPFSVARWTTKTTTGNAVWTGNYAFGVNNVGVKFRRYDGVSKLGRTIQVSIDDLQRPNQVRRGNLLPVVFSFNRDQLTGVTQGTRTTLLDYYSNGLLKSITDPLNHLTTFAYDLAERITTQTLPDGQIVQFTYDQAGRLTSVTPPSQPAHVFQINAKDLVGVYNPPPLPSVPQATTRYTYNNDEQLTLIIRPDGTQVALGYNTTTGLLGSLATPLGNYGVSYAPNSDLISKIDAPDHWRLAVGYSGKLPASQTWTAPSGAVVGVYSRSFDTETGLVAGDQIIVGNTSSTISSTYDADEYPKRIGDMALTYGVPTGLLSSTTIATNQDTYSYSGYGELTQYKSTIGTTVFYNAQLVRDRVGRITQKSETLPGAAPAVYAYRYDAAGRLQQVAKNGTTVSNYVYDGNGNRISGSRKGQAFKATYDDQDRLITHQTLTFVYNANGDLLSKATSAKGPRTQYAYDVLGNLRKVTLPDGTLIQYEIDGLNRRIGKMVNGKLTVRYLYQDQLRVAAELNPNGTLKRRYVYGTGRTTPDYYIQGAEKYKIISDYLGSPRAVVRLSTNTVVYRMDHDEFGRVILDSSPGFLPFGFAGGLYDAATGLVRFGSRDYDPETGHWTAKDPILFSGGDTNLYGYVLNDPVNLIDPNGTLPWLQYLINTYDKLSRGFESIELFRSMQRVWNIMKSSCDGPEKGAALLGEFLGWTDRLQDAAIGTTLMPSGLARDTLDRALPHARRQRDNGTWNQNSARQLPEIMQELEMQRGHH